MKTNKRPRGLLSREYQAAAFRALHGLDPKLKPQDIEPYSGTYELFKPSHNDPNGSINVGRLIIGLDAHVDGYKSAFNCSYESVNDGPRASIHAQGMFVPLYQTAAIFLSTAKHPWLGENIQLGLDALNPSHSENLCDSMGGTMISHATRSQPMSCPIYARRIDPNAFEFKTHTAEELRSLGRGPWDRLRRGNIYWAYETFPGFGLANVRAPSQP